jgi:hypothetical protein
LFGSNLAVKNVWILVKMYSVVGIYKINISMARISEKIDMILIELFTYLS